MIECTVKQRGKFFIVVDPFNQNSYTLHNRLEAESLCNTLNEAAYSKNEIREWVSKMPEIVRGEQ